jgi:hypothetical protein
LGTTGSNRICNRKWNRRIQRIPAGNNRHGHVSALQKFQFMGLASQHSSIKQETVQEECVQDDLGFIHHAWLKEARMEGRQVQP